MIQQDEKRNHHSMTELIVKIAMIRMQRMTQEKHHSKIKIARLTDKVNANKGYINSLEHGIPNHNCKALNYQRQYIKYWMNNWHIQLLSN